MTGVTQDLSAEEVARVLETSMALFFRRLRQVHTEGELSWPATSVLKRLERGGPATVSALAKAEQISVQSVGSTLAGLEAAGMVERRPDPADGRRVILSITEAGRRTLSEKHTVRTELMARALSSAFSKSELRRLVAAAPLIERLGEVI